MKYLSAIFILIFVEITSQLAYCQVDRGGVPKSFLQQSFQKSKLQVLEIAPPDLLSIHKEDLEDARLEKSYRVGVEVPVSLSPANSGQWIALPTGGRLWRIALSCKGAQAIGINYNELHLPEKSDFFVYTSDHQHIIGALTSKEVPYKQAFATRPLPGDELILEYYEPANSKEVPVIAISGISYIYRGFAKPESAKSASNTTGSCEVNVNCIEGLNWKEQKQAVVKIYTKVGGRYFYCTGTIMNNTSQDFKGLLLTASHCSKDFSGLYATEADLNQWVFYFNYESPGRNTTSSPEYTMVGAEKLAMSNVASDIGSDFLLLKFKTDIPPKYNPYYCGWDAGNSNSSSGVCIHHPNGEIKKISTYSSYLGSGTWGSTPNTHWTVRWVHTANGHGVTEGGSSGSPLFDDDKLVIGTLTGGESACSNVEGEDMFGKVSYSWTSNGSSVNMQLKPWLDPGNTGISIMPGTFNEKYTVADLSANIKVIPVGAIINFTDISSGKPTKWHWYFQGARPAESTEQNPTGIRFEKYGEMNVKLVVSNDYNSDSIVKEGYIDVRAVISPNPSTGLVSILTDMNNEEDVIIDVFDALGKIAQHFRFSGSTSPSYSIKLPDHGNVFIVRIIQGDQVQTHKVVMVHKR